MINLPYRSVPFRSMIKEKTNSITGTLKDQGYGGIVAFHPGLADSYNRNNVYPLLGFDKVIAYEDLKKPEKIRDYVSDAYDYKVVEDEYEKYRKSGSKKPFFMFNVTIQNHAAYKLRTGRVDAGISITNADQQEEEAIQFLNLMKQSDDALRELLAYYQNVSEPTVIILFGDHQPRLGNSFYDALLGKEKSELSLSETELKYKVPYFIWSNYDIADLTSDEREDISANYLSAYAFEKIGIKMSGYDKYRMELSEDYPVVTANGFIDKDGKIHNPLEKDDEKELREYSYVQYHDLVDHGEGNESFFRLSD
jgi:phosphoglycerol transferase MdoB-like AlkP superfamily enzyme